MSWRGQGGRRARGRRGDQDPELDQTAWLAELEREAAQAVLSSSGSWPPRRPLARLPPCPRQLIATPPPGRC